MTSAPATSAPVALVTGASQGLGLALARRLAEDGWHLIVDARRPDLLDEAVARLPPGQVTAIAGDVADPPHRAELARAVDADGRLDLLVHNASALGPSPLPALAAYPLDELRRVYEVDVLAPLALTQLLLPTLRRSGGILVALSSDAAVEAYEGWGGYGAAKAALDHLMAVLAVENPDLRIYAVDPGDMNTAMHQAAFPGEDITDRPLPETVVPAFLALIGTRPASGRYRAADLASVPAGTGA
jgi:NAD(P)-dependent dehydrogenase (short-subunit alcohol dehydrogenase family)